MVIEHRITSLLLSTVNMEETNELKNIHESSDDVKLLSADKH